MPTEHPIRRLARYDGTEFQRVDPGELAAGAALPGRVLHVFVHGWQPGFRVRERLLATVEDVAALPAWDRRLVDRAGRPLIDDYLDLLDALAGLGREHLVLWYSWLDESATDADLFQAYRSRQATQINGRRLALALHSSGGVGPRTRLHLVGHSHGSAVVVHAAAALSRPPDQLTLLDAPEDPISRVGGARDMIDVVLPRLAPGRGPGQVFVESYASAFGRPYHRRPGLGEVVDVQLGAPLTLSRDPVRMINAAHLYPVQWYARSVREKQRGVGYGWSPLTGADPALLHSWYHAALPQFPFTVRRHVADPLTRFGEALTERVAARVVERHDPAEPQEATDQASAASASGRRRRPRRRPVDDVALSVDGASTAAAIVVTRRGDELIEFDLALAGCRGDERVEIDLDGAAVFTCQADRPVPPSGRYLLLADGRAGEHLITLRLRGARSRGRARVTGLHLVAAARPAPGFTLARSATLIFAAGAVTGGAATLLGALGMWGTLRRLSRRRRGPGVPGRRS